MYLLFEILFLHRPWLVFESSDVQVRSSTSTADRCYGVSDGQIAGTGSIGC